MNILLEGKKEIIEKTKKKHSTDGEFIDRMFAIDPTSQGKYAEWIGKYLDSSLKFKDYSKIEDMITKIIIPFEKNYKRIDDDIVNQFIEKLIESGVKLVGKELSDVEKIKKIPRDINSYSIPFYIIAMLQVLDENKTRVEKERLAKKDVDKVFEDANYLVVRPLSYDASCYYGKETRWCTSSKESDSHYKRYSRDGVLYYFIDKRYPRDKVALYLEKDGKKLNKLVYNSADTEMGINFLYDQFPELSTLIGELTEQLPIVNLLKGYISGKDNSSQILSSDIVSGFEKNENDRGESLIEFSFDGLDDFKKVIDLSDDDEWFLGMLDSSHYNDYDFYGMDADSEWNEGYMLDRFNDENTKLLREILKYILPEYANADLSDDEIRSNIAQTLNDMFEYEVDSIKSEYQSEMNRAAETGARNTVESELCDYFERYGIKKSSENCFNGYETTINNLIKLFEEHQPKKNTIKSLLKTITEDDSVGGWSENSYEMIDWEAFDEEGFQREVERNLERIKDEIEENENFPQYKEVFDAITKNYEIQRWYNLPRNKDVSFRINGIDMDDLSISVTLNGKMGFSKYILNSVDEFYSLLYNYKLFDDN